MSIFHKFKERLRHLFFSRHDADQSIIRSATHETALKPAHKHVRSVTPIGLNLGIDFGTKFTKVCFRDVARNSSWIISFGGPVLACPEDAMLPSRICIDENGIVTSCLTTHEWQRFDNPSNNPKHTPIEYIKIRLAQLDLPAKHSAWQPLSFDLLKDESDIEALSAFYLTGVINRSRRWIEQNHHDLIVGRPIVWSACVGVPVEYCDSPALRRFNLVLKTAWFWAQEGESHRARMSLHEIKQRVASLRVRAENEAADCSVLPEIAAAVQSFIASPEAKEGIYTYFDIGSGTLDGVMFRYNKLEGRASLNFYAGHVWPLGVSAVSEQLLSQSAYSLGDIENRLNSEHSGARSEGDFRLYRKKVYDAVAQIFMEGKTKDPNGLMIQDHANMVNLPLFLGGGGGGIPFYSGSIKSAYADRLASTRIRPYVTSMVPKPPKKDLAAIPLDSYSRFSIAYGLSIPEGDVPEWHLPSEIGEMVMPTRFERNRTIDYQDTKDAFD